MRISHSSYQKYLNKIKKEIIGEIICSPILLNNKTLIFPLLNKVKQCLILSLNSKFPIVYKYKNELFFSSFENKFLLMYKKQIGKAQIKEINLKKDDLILEITIRSLDSFSDYKMIVEMIPNHPNLIITDFGKNVILKYFETNQRKLTKGEKYESIENYDFKDGDILVNEQLLKNFFDKEMIDRDKEKYAEFRMFLSSKIKRLKRKEEAIKRDVEIATKNLIYREIADDILCSNLNFKSHQSEYRYNENTIKLDEAKTILENAENFYKKTKKANITISRSDLYISNIKKEIFEFEKIIIEFEKLSELKKDEIVSTYFNKRKKKEVQATIINRPWKINLNGTIIYFGRNASQNDFLSFVMKLDREFTWMHIKDKSGAHLVIANKHPTNKELLIGAEISLLCSKTSSGEVTYTKKKNIRRGHTLGEAIIKNASNIKLNNIQKETIALFEKAVRCN